MKALNCINSKDWSVLAAENKPVDCSYSYLKIAFESPVVQKTMAIPYRTLNILQILGILGRVVYYIRSVSSWEWKKRMLSWNNAQHIIRVYIYYLYNCSYSLPSLSEWSILIYPQMLTCLLILHMKTIRAVEIPFVTLAKLDVLLFLSQSWHHSIYYKTFIFSNSSFSQSHLNKKYSQNWGNSREFSQVGNNCWNMVF